MTTYRNPLARLSRKEKRGGGLVLGLVIVTAVLETGGAVSLMPFPSVLANPDGVQASAMLNAVFDGLGSTSADTFLLALGAAAFGLILFSAFVSQLLRSAVGGLN